MERPREVREFAAGEYSKYDLVQYAELPENPFNNMFLSQLCFSLYVSIFSIF